MLFDKAKSAGYLANHMARLFANGLSDRIRPLGLTPGQFPALLELWETDGLSQKDLVRLIDVEQATLANTLTRMERDGLIVRRSHPRDGRVQQIWLTEFGRSLRDAATQAAEAQNAAALKLMSEAERAELIRLMALAIRAMRTCREGSGAHREG